MTTGTPSLGLRSPIVERNEVAISKFIHLGKGWECLLRACLHGSVGVQVGEVGCLGGVTCRSHNVSF